MNIILQGDNDIKNTIGLEELSSKGEGTVFLVDGQGLVKLYHGVDPDKGKFLLGKDTPEVRKLKIRKFVDTFFERMNVLEIEDCAFPKKLVYEDIEAYNTICGFSMDYFKDAIVLQNICYNKAKNRFNVDNNVSFNDDNAIVFIYDLFVLMYKLHYEAGVILGDINDENFMVDSKTLKPYIIDIDSAKIDDYECVVCSPEYIDPFVEEQGVSPKGGFYYTRESDNFSLACICFEVYLGASPYSFPNDSRLGVPQAKRRNLSILHFIYYGCDEYEGVKIVKSPMFVSITERLLLLKQKDIALYTYFVSVFVKQERSNLINTLPENHKLNPTRAMIFYYDSGAYAAILEMLERRKKYYQRKVDVEAERLKRIGYSKKIIRTKDKTKQDPQVLNTFLAHYGINVAHLIS